MISEKKLKKFLWKAKINTYANSGEGKKIKLKDSGNKFEYRKGDFYYRDIYYGFNRFAGQEVVFYIERPIWSMSYRGQIVDGSISTKEVYLFLREALRKVTQLKPFRGPDNFKDEKFRYLNNFKGKLESFVGTEKIYYKNRLVYKLEYVGGSIALVPESPYK